MTLRICLLLSVLASSLTFLFQDYRYGERIAAIERDSAEAVIAAVKKAQAAERKGRAAMKVVVTDDTARREQVKTESRVIKKEVRDYAKTSPNAGSCQYGDDWVRKHDNAAKLSHRAQSRPSVDDATTRITDVEALEVVTDNYLDYAEVAANLAALQHYVNTVVLPLCQPP